MSYQPHLPGFAMSNAKDHLFDIDEALRRIDEAVEPFPKAALFELAEEGYDSPFEQLVACIISIRTRDETMYPTAKALFESARTPTAIASMTVEEIDEVISGASFHERKASQIADIARRLVDEHEGQLPCDEAILLDFHGVGPKCANLVLGIACGEASVGVDVHVHRVTNRWGYVDTKRPEQTMKALEEKLPRKYWVEINRLLVPFGKHICTGRLPNCSTCPVEPLCAQAGVEDHR
jgi:endonuclease-3